MTRRIMIVDDERDIVELLKDYFTWNGYEVVTAFDGGEALRRLDGQIDLILLDVNMPGMDGMEVCRRIRDLVRCPILFLTARIEDRDKIQGFQAGGDDYIVKPFSIDELGARVSAHIRRDARSAGHVEVRFDTDLSINFTEKMVSAQGQQIPLGRREYEILELLAMNAGQVFDRERIYERLWGYDADGDSNVITEHVRRLRAKLAAAGCKNHVETVWGMGYKWVR
ncbi:MAG: response regulator transcription factor [Clostridia bacterium]|nr:response regulator transcription factor [Clostridia bacterium]